MKVLSITCLVLLAMLVILVLIFKAFIKDQEELEQKIKKQQTNIEYLLKNANDVANINKNSSKIREAINSAKNDEDIENIINDIVRTNNKRVQVN